MGLLVAFAALRMRGGECSEGTLFKLLGGGVYMHFPNHLVGLVVTASAWRAEDPRFESHLHRDFSGSSHTIDLKIGTPVATLPGAWRYRISVGNGRPGVSIL